MHARYIIVIAGGATHLIQLLFTVYHCRSDHDVVVIINSFQMDRRCPTHLPGGREVTNWSPGASFTAWTIFVRTSELNCDENFVVPNSNLGIVMIRVQMGERTLTAGEELAKIRGYSMATVLIQIQNDYLVLSLLHIVCPI